jgi:TonB family protein
MGSVSRRPLNATVMQEKCKEARSMKKFLAAVAPALLICAPAFGQQSSREVSNEKCPGPVYKHDEVSQRPIFYSRPSPTLTDSARAHGVRGQVVLSAVLCKSGHVTDIDVIEPLPDGVTERALEAARQTKFAPAKKDGLPVSEQTTFIFQFRYIGERGPLAREPLRGRLIESVELTGNAESGWDELKERITTRPGDIYDKEKIEANWQKLLEATDSDKEASTLRIEEGNRGGIAVVFELKTKRKVFAQPNNSQTTSQTQTAGADRDGSHDFDWDIGTWKTHQRRLLRPLTGSTSWVEYNGTDVVRKIWEGANQGIIEADGSAGHLEIFTLRVYNPDSHQWNIYFVSPGGMLSQPVIGEFKNGRGEFYDQETYKGRSILVRFAVSDITATSCHFEQAFSADGGKTWEVNFIVTEALVKDGPQGNR